MAENQEQLQPPSTAPTRVARAPLARKLTFAAVTICFFFAALEMIGRTVVPMNAGNSRWSYETNHVRLSGFPALNTILEPDPARFWRLRSNVAPTQIIGRVGADDLVFTLSTDQAGFRQTPTVTSQKRTILFMGDSCTLGIGVDDAAAIPAVVQRQLVDTRCVNAGVPGYSAYQGRVYLESVIRDIRPAVVVINFGFNDDAAWDDRSDPQHATELAAPSDWPDRFGITRLIGRLTSGASSTTKRAGTSRPRLTDVEFAEQIESMIQSCAANNATPVLVIWPLREQVAAQGMMGKQMALARIAQSKGIAVVNLVDMARMRKPASVDIFADLLHFNETGCKWAGVIIADVLRPSLMP